MALDTAFTRLTGCSHPIVSAPMAGSAGGALAAAVSNAGGFGLVGGGTGAADWLEPQLQIATDTATAPWGVGLLTWGIDASTVERACAFEPAAVLLAFGDPTPYAQLVHDAGALLFVQVTELDEARQALDAGGDVLIAQGGEAGGHSGGTRGTLSFVPVVADLAAGRVPVLAAGGIADGRGIAAALALGAAGALVGTRFQASREAVVSDAEQKAILAGSGDDTTRSTVPDIARGSAWPARYPGRALRNRFLDEWHGRADELRADADALAEARQALARRDPDVVPVWASAAIDLITELSPAADLVARLAAETDAVLTQLARLVD